MDWSFGDIVDGAKKGWDWLDDIMGSDGGDGVGAGGNSLAVILGLLGASGMFDSDQDKVGYQGKIPRYSAVRDKVPWNDQNRQPGEYGKRYFTDTFYADQPNPPAGLMSIEQARDKALQQRTNLAEQNKNQRPIVPPNFAQGGIARLLGGPGDGMGDSIPAMIEGQQPAALSHGEMVIPADVVSHLGNGNTEAGAKQFYDMMERVRKARTGSAQQGKQINPRKYLPA